MYVQLHFFWGGGGAIQNHKKFLKHFTANDSQVGSGLTGGRNIFISEWWMILVVLHVL